MVISRSDSYPEIQIKKKFSNTEFLILNDIIAIVRQSTFCMFCKMIYLCFLFKFCAPKQIWDSTFVVFSKISSGKTMEVRERNEFVYFETIFRTVGAP